MIIRPQLCGNVNVFVWKSESCVHVVPQVMLVEHEGSGGYMALKVLSKYKLQVRHTAPHLTRSSGGIADQL